MTLNCHLLFVRFALLMNEKKGPVSRCQTKPDPRSYLDCLSWFFHFISKAAKTFRVVLIGVAVLTVMSARAKAIIVGFEGFAPNGDLVNVNPGAPYAEAGFLFIPTSGASAIFDSASMVGLSGNGTDFFGFGEGNSIAVIQFAIPGVPFDIAGLEIGRTNLASAPTVTISFMGTLAAGGTVSTSFSAISTFRPVTLNWTGLSRLEFFASDDAGVDNLSMRIPEPTISGFAGLLAIAALIRRR